MTDFNMPPGCSVRDIPGNRLEDQAMEAFYDAFYDQIPFTWTDEAKGQLAAWVWSQMGESYREGYNQGQADAGLAADWDVFKSEAR